MRSNLANDRPGPIPRILSVDIPQSGAWPLLDPQTAQPGNYILWLTAKYMGL